MMMMTTSPYGMLFTQLACGIAIVFAVFMLSLHLLKQDKLLIDNKVGVHTKQRTKILDGYIDSNSVVGKRYNTLNPSAKSFVSLPRSFNRKGGAQFTYSFWLYLGDTTAATVANKDILVRGDIRQYSYQKTSVDQTGKPVVQTDTDLLIKSPRIRFGNTFQELVVEFNTQDEISHKAYLHANNAQDDSTMRHNVMGMIPKRWVLMTFVFEDNVAINDFEDGIVLRFYVNDILYYTHRVQSTLKQNNGDLYLFPSGEVKNCRISNLAYFNYAMGSQEVKDIYNAGRPTHVAQINEGNTFGDPLFLSEYNKLDIYNA